MDQPVEAFDFGRMLFGDEPPLFLLEIAFRTVVIYLYTLVLIRWIGSRSIAQLSLVEFLLVIALGSAVGDAMFYPDVPLIHCMIVITVVASLDKLLSFLVSRSPRLEDAIEGKSVEIVRDGIIACSALKRLNFGHDELFEQLRLKEVEHLGQVQAAYLETNGMLSVFKSRPALVDGLVITPPWDVKPPLEQSAGSKASVTSRVACARCGSVTEIQAGAAVPCCGHCAGTLWHATATSRP